MTSAFARRSFWLSWDGDIEYLPREGREELADLFNLDVRLLCAVLYIDRLAAAELLAEKWEKETTEERYA